MAKKKKITFNHKDLEIRTAVIETKEFETFKIKFRVPKKGAALALGATFASDDFNAKADVAVQYIAAHLVEWDLEMEPTTENIDAIDQTEVVAAMFFKIANAGAKRKN